MQTLVRKELREIARPFLVLLALLCALWFLVAKFQDVLLRPQQEPLFAVLGVCAFWGAALGFGQFASERWRGTNAFLVHRGTGRWGAFVAKAAVGSLSTFCLAIVPPIVFALWYWLATPYGPVVQGARIAELGVVALFAFPCYAVGVLAAALRRARAWSWLLASLGTFGAVIIAMWAAIRISALGLGWVGAIAGIVLVAAGLFAIAWHLLRLEDDREFALPPRHSVAMAFASLVLVVAPLLNGLLIADVLLAEDLGPTPVLVQSEADGEFFFIAPDADDSWRRLDGKPLPGGAASLRDWHPWGSSAGLRTVYNPAYGGVTSEPRPWPAIPARASAGWIPTDWVPLGTPATDGDGWRTESALDLSSGLVRCFVLPPLRDSGRSGMRFDASGVAADDRKASATSLPPVAGMARQYALAKPGGGRFSLGTVGLGSDGITMALCDPADGTLWTFVQAPGEPRLAPIALPNGDRLARLENLYQPESAEIGWYAIDWSVGPLIVGDHGRYVWQSLSPPSGIVDYDTWEPPRTGSAPEVERVVPIDPSAAPVGRRYAQQPGRKPLAASDVPSRIVARIDTLDSDPLHPRLALRAAKSDELLCTVEIEPSTQGGLMAERALLALSFLRPPWATAWNFFEAAPSAYPGRTSAAQEDLFRGGRRAGLAAACIGLALALAAWVVLRGSGARGPRWTWAVLVALFGLPVFAMYLLCEPRRSRAQVSRATAREPVTSAQPLIQST